MFGSDPCMTELVGLGDRQRHDTPGAGRVPIEHGATLRLSGTRPRRRPRHTVGYLAVLCIVLRDMKGHDVRIDKDLVRPRRRRSYWRSWPRARATGTRCSSGCVSSRAASWSGPTGCSTHCSTASAGSVRDDRVASVARGTAAQVLRDHRLRARRARRATTAVDDRDTCVGRGVGRPLSSSGGARGGLTDERLGIPDRRVAVVSSTPLPSTATTSTSSRPTSAIRSPTSAQLVSPPTRRSRRGEADGRPRHAVAPARAQRGLEATRPERRRGSGGEHARDGSWRLLASGGDRDPGRASSPGSPMSSRPGLQAT